MRELATPQQAVQWFAERGARALACDSRALEAGDGFIAWPGAATDARRFVPQALAAGAAACLVEREGVEAFGFDDPRVAAYPGLKAATGEIAALQLGRPSARLAVLAVTGTNGKTSTAWWLAQAGAQALGAPCGLVGTLGIGVPPQLQSTGLTTPDPVRLQGAFADFAQRGFGACAIEASSIGLAEGRLAGTDIAVAVFTNFSRDHLDYHGTMQAYWAAKAALFDWPGLQAAVVNIDDAKGEELAAQLAGRGVPALWTTSCMRSARLRARDLQPLEAGMAFTLVEGDTALPLRTPLLGAYNVANLLGVIGALRALGVPLAEAAAACGALTPVPGRLESVGGQGAPLVVIDYAHTPDALDKVLGALRPVAQSRGGRLWCVFGCGGNRDATKRPLMAAVAEKGADRVVVTSDNPRHERPEAIIAQVLLGLSRRDAVQVEVQRAEAIAQAVTRADARDVVLLAGKGHEPYQEIGDQKLPFSDRTCALDALTARGALDALTQRSPA